MLRCGLDIPPGEAAVVGATRGFLPFSLGRETPARPVTVGIRVIPVHVDHRPVRNGLGHQTALPEIPAGIFYVLRSPMAGGSHELQISPVRDFEPVEIVRIQRDLVAGILVPSSIAVPCRDAHREGAGRHQNHRGAVFSAGLGLKAG